MKLTNQYFETLATKDISSILNKSFKIKTAYWLARLFDKIETESKQYFIQKQKLIEKYANRDEAREIISTKEGISIKNPEKFRAELNELLRIDFEFEWEKIVVDFEKEDVSLSIDEMMILIPFLEEVKNG